ncbi:MAG: hypothetical protein A2087_10945 [Spirochaetes bacterium GWD1_61_31]|nr:MAG: hypothetical protein A2Y37_06890 [Spirochaetes bacterium GWB1_60_80]OHD30800.1 MAG: hypothetical protein A2004_04415 [Spirochaetes bacterium GWC1_61_12]OHD36409.1 MAG: hypothetical protein A2087_10945 [Spirochaetes bacterium GWD1_61_31]OHD46300.1 MAG: hypothetical protein A2Y35_07165 [Spirochaetes bacterium GWE1_60_18]OHD60907.1 MAG: hypothetical protein A2Y32_11910 [Spirochaetes bacterium GWF1_60_12]HAP42835.1 hypothetical protein [Spirochaetaceae bacterium]
MVFQYEGWIIPIEVKAGTAGSLKSLHQFLQEFREDLAVRFYGGKRSLEAGKTPAGKGYRLLNLPFCLAGQLQRLLGAYL